MRWTARSSESWCSVSPASGDASTKGNTITFNANDTYSDRSCTVTIMAGDLSKDITINQSANSGLSVSQNKYDLNNKALPLKWK